MAIDKAVDSGKLNNALEATADAIREKTGDYAYIAFDLTTETGFAEAVEAIPSGGGNPLEYATFSQYGLFYVANFPEGYQLDITAPNVRISDGGNSRFIASAFYGAEGGKNGKFKFSTSKQLTALSSVFRSCNIEQAEFILDFDKSQITSYSLFASGAQDIYIKGAPIDFSMVTSRGSYDGAYKAFQMSKVVHVEFVPNSLRIGGNGEFDGWIGMDDDTLVSLANCLNESAHETTMLDSTVKSRAVAMLGNVELDSTNTYHVFTADDGGNTTLADFITDVKGWTIA